MKIEGLIDDFKLVKSDLVREIVLFFEGLFDGHSEVVFGGIRMDRIDDGGRIIVSDVIGHRYLDACSVDDLVGLYEEYCRS